MLPVHTPRYSLAHLRHASHDQRAAHQAPCAARRAVCRAPRSATERGFTERDTECGRFTERLGTGSAALTRRACAHMAHRRQPPGWMRRWRAHREKRG
ncbi:Hypothetical protein CAP_8275 [Chondromyces apiculatus DSM 436]|uniref:Uncharacterized protein n=1 Tax=Chondromyces apiculatus DSM 436 TaxID=1192034 RepID=A0A017SXE9_9BACT|nr:Hypothetical protein CAP_8275 [Chondromyces apiculatus DSM 436]